MLVLVFWGYFVFRPIYVIKVVSHYDLRVLSMSVKGFHKNDLDSGVGSALSIFLGIFNFFLISLTLRICP